MANFDTDIGALWIRKSQKGTSYMTGQVELGNTKVDVVVFRNTKKQPGEKTPDFRIYLSEPKPDAPVASAQEPAPDGAPF
jgi:uncharacterized protein (DUF736 family)